MLLHTFTMNLQGKTVVLGVTGGIAAYKVAEVASFLTKQGADVHVIMTKNATEFITPLTFETLTGNKTIVDTFDRNFEWNVKHVSLAKRANVFLVAPATANCIAKFAYGLADDMLSTTMLAAKCPKIIAPAMNTGMYENPIVQKNIEILKQAGFKIISPECGRLACGDIGAGRLAAPELLIDSVIDEIACDKDLLGKQILVTAGPTHEMIDPVRFITNHSSGKMGYEIAKAARLRGAKVTLVSGPVSLKKPYGVDVIDVVTADDMFHAVKDHFESSDIVIKAAAVGDFKAKDTADHKIKKNNDDDIHLELTQNEDILAFLGKNKRSDQIICGFSMETNDLIENSTKKLNKKNADLIIANSLTEEGAGFKGDTNIVTIISKNDNVKLEKMTKEQVAHKILDYILKIK